MGLFSRKKIVSVVEATFKVKVSEFWAWWSENASRIRASVDSDGGREIQPEISEQVSKLGPHFAWVLGPHPEGEEHGHSLTLSPEGVLNYLFLTSYWLKRAPKVDGWHFYSSRQPSTALDGAAIRIGDFELKASELWLTPAIDEEKEQLDITAWSPIFAEIEERVAFQVLFLLLDEALGENGVSQWLGHIEMKDDQLAESFPLSELPEQLEIFKEKFEWKKFPLEETYTLYRFKNPEKGFPRQDLITLNTQNPRVTLDYIEAEGCLDDPIDNTGASYCFIQIPMSQFTEKKQVDIRAAWEDALEESLSKEQAGRILGGGLGTEFAYIDLLIFDGDRSMELIKQTLDQHEARQYRIIPFAK